MKAAKPDRVKLYLKETGRILAEKRRATGLTRKELAEKAGVTPLKVRICESGNGNYYPSEFFSMAVALDAGPLRIMGEAEKRVVKAGFPRIRSKPIGKKYSKKDFDETDRMIIAEFRKYHEAGILFRNGRLVKPKDSKTPAAAKKPRKS